LIVAEILTKNFPYLARDWGLGTHRLQRNPMRLCSLCWEWFAKYILSQLLRKSYNSRNFTQLDQPVGGSGYELETANIFL
jgi:hypothetical protein